MFKFLNEQLTSRKFLANNQKTNNFVRRKFEQSEFLTILQEIKKNFAELIENFCGVLEDNCLFQELSADENKEEVVIQLRELNMFKVLQEEVKIYWEFY